MLSQLHIRNFAIIDELTLEMASGMTVLSGETGAGKSILVDALGLLLGDRAETDAIRQDAERAEIDAEFVLDDAGAAQAWLHAHDFNDEAEPGTCMIRRVLLREGRTRAYINGRPCNARDLKALGELLIDIHGQHAHQSLLRPQTQRRVLDAYGDCDALLARTAELARHHGELTRQIEALAGGDEERAQRLEFLRFQVNELEALGLGPDELQALEEEHRRLANADRLLQEGQQAYTLLYEGEEGAAYDLLGQAQRLLEGLAGLDRAFASPAELIEAAAIQAQEAADAVRNHLEALEADPQRLGEVESRLSNINDMARKHHVSLEALPQRLEALRQELEELEGGAERARALEEEREAVLARYREAAGKLGDRRRAAASELADAVTEGIRSLGMPEGAFEVRLEARESTSPHPAGLERVEFLISANPGQSPRPLTRVASGGELSRISLAIEVIAAHSEDIASMVFDEVDTGIGGGVAEIVGRRLRGLARSRQVLCVTHLPQVAAQAHHHLRVTKAVDKGLTRTEVAPLDEQQTIEELARMLGGLNITKQTRAHAQEMKQQAQEQP